MGKVKKNKPKRNISLPTGLPSVKDFEEQMEASGMGVDDHTDISNAILNLVEKLQSPSADERECTCSTIANLIEQPGAVAQLLAAGVVRSAGPLLVDPSQSVRHAALGALRNMTVEGGAEVCEGMVKQDVMTPLVTLLLKFGQNWLDDDKNQEADVFHQALHLMWNLCEASATAVKISNQQNLLQILVPCLKPASHGLQIAITAAQCIYTITEDNQEAARLLSTSDSLRELHQLLKPTTDGVTEQQLTTAGDATEHLLHQLLIAGILYNISEGDLSNFESAVLSQVIDLLVKILQQDVHIHMRNIVEFANTLDVDDGAVSNLSSKSENLMTAEQADLADAGEEDELMGDDDNEEEDGTDSAPSELEVKHGELDEKVSRTRTLITAQLLAVELVANFCCSSDDDDGWEEAEGSDSGGDDVSSDTGEDTMDDQDLGNDSFCLPSEMKNAFVSSGLITQVFHKIKPAEEDLCLELAKHEQMKAVKSSYESLVLQCLLCTGNLVDAVEVEDLGGTPALHELWSMLTQLAGFAAAQTSNDLLEGATTALRAVVDKLDELESQKLTEVAVEDLEFVYRLGTECTHCQVRANAIRIAGTIGCVLAQHQRFILLKGVGEFFCRVMSSENEQLWIVAEALDALFDVFAEDDTDPVVKELGLIRKLKELVPVLKKKVQQQKTKLGEHRAIISTAKTNLVRFIKYKSRRPTAV